MIAASTFPIVGVGKLGMVRAADEEFRQDRFVLPSSSTVRVRLLDDSSGGINKSAVRDDEEGSAEACKFTSRAFGDGKEAGAITSDTGGSLDEEDDGEDIVILNDFYKLKQKEKI